MVDDFQRSKLIYLFKLFDLNKDHFVQMEDFSEMAEKVRSIMKYEDGSKEHKRITDKATKFFHSLVKDISPVDKLQISQEEWVSFFENVILKDEEALDQYKEMVFAFMFDFFDQNRDGFISKNEYQDFYKIFGIDDQYLDKAFEKLDMTNSEKLSRYDLLSAVEEFFISTNRELAGNWVFGNWNSKPEVN